MNPIIECRGLSKKYANDFYALANLNLVLERGQIIGLLGPNGSGKTTLIKLINDLLVPTEGSIWIAGKTPGVETKKLISYLPERTYLDSTMKIQDLIHYFTDFYGNFIPERAYHMLEDLKSNRKTGFAHFQKGRKKRCS